MAGQTWKRGMILGVGLVAGLVTWSQAGLGQDEWPMFQANPSHTGYVAVTIDPDSIETRWSKAVSTKRLNPVAAADGMVFVSEGAGFSESFVYGLDASTGDVVWDFDVGDPFSLNPPSYADGRVFFQTGNHGSDTWLHAVEAATGAYVFRSPHSAQWEEYYAPTPFDGKVYINGGYYGGMYGFDGVTGDQDWFAGLPQYDEWTPAVDEEYAYAYVGGWLFVHDRFSGVESFKIQDPNFDWRGWSMGLAPVLGSMDNVFVVHGGRLMSFDLVGRTITFEQDRGYVGQPALKDGVLHVVGQGSLFALDEATGDELWRWIPPADNLVGGVIVTQQHALVQSATTLYLIDVSSHDVAWTTELVGHVAVSETAIYVAQSDGNLTSLGFEGIPTPTQVIPDRWRYTEPQVAVEIHGSAFLRGGEVAVSFGGELAEDVVVVDDSLITCKVPALGPGLHDVSVHNDNGRGTLDRGFVAFPALDLGGDLRTGGEVEGTFYCRPGDSIVTIVGVPPDVEVETPPFGGTLCIVPFQVLFILPEWPFEDFHLQTAIPDDPVLTGVEVLLQALSGPEFAPPSKDAAWTNCFHLFIE